MIWLLLVLYIAGFTCLLYMFRISKEKYIEEEISKNIGNKRVKGVHFSFINLMLPPALSKTKNNIRFLILPIIGFLAARYFNFPAIVGIVLGIVAPVVYDSTVRAYYLGLYRKDVRTAFTIAYAVFSAGGSVEKWIDEAAERLKGRLKQEFVYASKTKHNISISEFLKRLAQRTPDEFFRYGCLGILSNYKEADNLATFMQEIMDELIQQERSDRVKKQQRNQWAKMLIGITATPLGLYFLFQDEVNYIISQQTLPANIALGIVCATYIGAIYWAIQLTKSKTLN